MNKEFQPLSNFSTSQEAVDYIKNGGWVLIEQIAITDELLTELQNPQKNERSLYPNGIFIGNEKKIVCYKFCDWKKKIYHMHTKND